MKTELSEGRLAHGWAEALPEGRVRCRACARGCLIEEGQLGFCRVRRNEAGRLIPLSYGRVAAVHLANVERKPLYHFYPGVAVKPSNHPQPSLRLARGYDRRTSRGWNS